MPKYTLGEEKTTPPTRLELRPGPKGSVELVASGGNNNDEQVVLALLSEGCVIRTKLAYYPARRLGLILNDEGLIWMPSVDSRTPAHDQRRSPDVED